jgi:hypothetical protein
VNFMADENIDRQIVGRLRREGHNNSEDYAGFVHHPGDQHMGPGFFIREEAAQGSV